ncbi:MAG: putative metal-binding motif-containing protein [Myxococcaceae bacterium]|nr:putative metal-binding motif-containing protein [Myxococcaceae bacterium]
MKKLSLAALLVILSACNRQQQVEGEAIHAKVVLSPPVKATCVLFEIRDVADHHVLQEKWLPRADDDLQIAIFRGALPKDVELAARPYLGGDCQNGTEAQSYNGPYETAMATFVEGKVPDVITLELKPGQDGDTDEYVSVEAGGLDCRDGDSTINPGRQETCADQVDLNCDNQPGCQAAGCAANACVGPPTALALTVEASVIAGDCKAGTLQVKDAQGSNTRVTAATSVGMQATPAGGIRFYSDAGCTTPVTSVTLPANEGSATFHFQGQVAGSVTITASAPSLQPDSKSVSVTPGAGNQLVFQSPPRAATAGACSMAVQVQSQDAQGNPKPAAAATQIQLQADPDVGFLFYSDSMCNTPATNVTLAAGTSTASFYFRGTRAGSVTVAITATGYTGGTQAQTINPGPPSALVFTGPTSAQAGGCSAFTVEVRDAHGNPTTTGSDRQVNLSATGGVTFFSNSGCSNSVTTVTIRANSGSEPFFARGTQAGDFTLTGTASGLTSATHSLAILAGPATALVFTTGAQNNVVAGSCSAVVTVRLEDTHGNPANAASAMTVGLSVVPAQGFQFFAGAGCAGTAVTDVPLPMGASSASFSFRSTRAGAVTLTASTGVLSVDQGAIILAAPPSVLFFPQSPLAMTAGACTQVTLEVRDAHGNLSNVSGNSSMALAASPAAGFKISSQNACGNTITSVQVNSGQSSATFYVQGTTAQGVTVTATRAGFTDGSLAVTVNPDVPDKLAFQPPGQMVEVDTCSGITTVQVQDANNNVTTVGANTLVNLTGANTTFYTDATCTAPAVTSVTIPSGGSSASFRFKNSTIGTVTLTAASAGLTSGTQDQTITPPPPTELAFTTTEQTRAAGACSGVVTVQARRTGTPVNVSVDTIVTLTASPIENFTFYSDAGCTNPAGQVTILTGQNSANFYFRGTQVGTVILTAASGVLTSANQNAIITAAAPGKLRFTTSPHVVTAGTCSPAVTVQVTDNFNNTSAVTADTTANLNASGTAPDSNFHFYSEPTCTTVVTTRVIPTGQTEVSFYYQGPVARGVDIAVSAGGLTATPVQRHDIVAANATALVFAASTPTASVLAGTCTLRTVESRDTHGNPARNALTVDLSASPVAEFFLDASCTTPTNLVSIPQDSSTADFYFKAISGGINTTATLGLTASSTGLTPATRNETINPTVRSGSCTIASNATNSSNTCAISPALTNMDKAFLVFQATSAAPASEGANVRCFVETVSQVTCERGDNKGGGVTIQWSVAELPPTVVSVQHSSITCAADTSPVTVNPAVNRDNTFLLLSSRRDTPDQGNTIPRLAELTSTTAAEIRKMNGCANNDTNHLQVVSYTGATVQRRVDSLLTGTSTQINLASSVALDRSILLYSYISDGFGLDICERALRGELTNGGAQVSFTRGDGDAVNCAGSQFTAISWEVVQFPAGTFVQQVTQHLAAGTASISTTLPTTVDASRTVVFVGGQGASGQALGEGQYKDGEIIGEMRARAELSADGTTVTLTRDSSISSAKFTFFVVQLKP